MLTLCFPGNSDYYFCLPDIAAQVALHQLFDSVGMCLGGYHPGDAFPLFWLGSDLQVFPRVFELPRLAKHDELGFQLRHFRVAGYCCFAASRNASSNFAWRFQARYDFNFSCSTDRKTSQVQRNCLAYQPLSWAGC